MICCAFCGSAAAYHCTWSLASSMRTLPVVELRPGDVIEPWSYMLVNDSAPPVRPYDYIQQVRSGSYIRIPNAGKRTVLCGERRFRIVDCECCENPDLLRFPLVPVRPPRVCRVSYSVILHRTAVMPTVRPAVCDLPACEAHVRELSERRHVCREHWDAWREVQ